MHNIVIILNYIAKEGCMKIINNGYTKTMTDETLRETICHGSEDYPFRYYYEDIWLFDFHCVDWHWHPEVEFVFVESGTVEFLIGSSRYTLGAGEGIFINTQVIHRFEAGKSAVIPNIVFSPALLSPVGSLIYAKYIKPLLASSVECLIFSRGHEHGGEMLDTLLAMFAAQEAEDVSQLETLALLLKLWGLMYETIGAAELRAAARPAAHTQAQLQIMMQYIHKNHPHPITLQDIAQTVSMSKSSILNIFKKYLHTSPVSYLVDYRLKQAAKLLINTENSIAAIAQDTGFENTGYFCRKFKKLFHTTPGAYRKMAQNRQME